MKTKAQRLNNIIGQINGVKSMLENNSDCLAVLTQLKAIRSAVSGVMDSVIEEQFDKCLGSLESKDREVLGKIKNYVKGN